MSPGRPPKTKGGDSKDDAHKHYPQVLVVGAGSRSWERNR